MRHNVTINNLLPGVFATDAQARHIRGMMDQFPGKSFEQVWDERGRSNPAGRYGEPEELGALCAYVCSAQAGYLTAQNILLDGGGYPGVYWSRSPKRCALPRAPVADQRSQIPRGGGGRPCRGRSASGASIAVFLAGSGRTPCRG